MEQITLFDLIRKPYKITNHIRLIELFAGVGSQAMALRDIGADYESYRVFEIDKYAIRSYNAIHGTNFVPTDITKIKGEDLGIVDTDKYTYLLTHFLAKTYQLPERCVEWKKEVEHDQGFCGKWRDY